VFTRTILLLLSSVLIQIRRNLNNQRGNSNHALGDDRVKVSDYVLARG
jgi:hypothetical protein